MENVYRTKTTTILAGDVERLQVANNITATFGKIRIVHGTETIKRDSPWFLAIDHL
jgi:hypothetical protein